MDQAIGDRSRGLGNSDRNSRASDEFPVGESSQFNSARLGSKMPSEFSGPQMSPDGEQNDPVAPENSGLPNSSPPREASDRYPREFGRYRLLQRLGGGGMGSVYLALDRKLDINVAIKIPRPEIFARAEMQPRFYREARAAARLVHPGLCWVMDVGQFEGTHYLVMRYVAGTPLSKCLPFTPLEAAALVRDIARAMAAAHKEGVIHRDLKPSNIIVTPEGSPVVVDFGLALMLDDELTRITLPGEILGTLAYMAPERLLADAKGIGPWSDVYSLGCVLYRLLTGKLPDLGLLASQPRTAESTEPVPPSSRNPEIDKALDAICLQAIARTAPERYQTMESLAADLDALVEGCLARSTMSVPRAAPVPATHDRPQPIRREVIRFAFAAPGSSAPRAGTAPDRLFLGVGNDLRAGVIDGHQLHSYSGSTARLVVSNRHLVTASIEGRRDVTSPLTLVLPEAPDFDCVAAAWLAIAVLTNGELPAGADALARYADKIDEGSIGQSLSNPFSPYAAYMQLLHRESRRVHSTDHELWHACIEQGLALVGHALEMSVRDSLALPSVDAFSCADVMGEIDRKDVLADIERYHRKLADARTRARVVRLSLPGQFGGRTQVDTLLVRDVQNADDPDRCIFFKDWARSDRERSPGGEGFFGLSVFVSETRHEVRHCILSVTAGSGASLDGLGELLDRAESEHRQNLYGIDDREVDPVTGSKKAARPGYDNSDPWYDGRAHGFTIVDSPRAGTLLSADTIEELFLKFGEKT
jgi:serine/threonine protein kinase